MPRTHHRTSLMIVGAIAAMIGCDPPSPPPRESPALRTTLLRPEITYLDVHEGRTYALALDGSVFDVADPTHRILMGPNYSRGFEMDSPTSAWLFGSDLGLSEGGLVRRGEGIEETISDRDFAIASGVEAATPQDLDVDADGALVVALQSQNSDASAVCTRSIEGSFSCASLRIGSPSIVALEDGSTMVRGLRDGPTLSILRDGVFADIPLPPRTEIMS